MLQKNHFISLTLKLYALILIRDLFASSPVQSNLNSTLKKFTNLFLNVIPKMYNPLHFMYKITSLNPYLQNWTNMGKKSTFISQLM